MDRIRIDDLQAPRGTDAGAAGAPGHAARDDLEGHAGAREGRRASTTSTSTTARRSAWSSAAGREKAFDLDEEKAAIREQYGKNTFGQCLPAGPATGRGRHAVRRGRTGRRWPTATTTRGTFTSGLSKRMKNQSGPDARRRPVGPDRRPGRARPAEGNAGGGGRRVRPQPAARRQHVGQPEPATTAATTGHTATRRSSPAPASSAATSTARATRPRSRPAREPGPPDRTAGDDLPLASASSRTRSSTTTSTSRANW